jgi:hypothetical protein
MALFTPEDSIDAWMQDTNHPRGTRQSQDIPTPSGPGGNQEGDAWIIGFTEENWIRRISYFSPGTSP